MARKSRSSEQASFSFPHKTVVAVASHRKWPDPVLPGVDHHSGYVPAILYPANGFPNDPNLRPANIDRQIYKDIAESLLNKNCTANTYHLKSKGEVQAAAHVRELSPTDSQTWFEEHVKPLVGNSDLFDDFQKQYKLLEVTYNEKQGILDGGHTDRIWSDDEYRTEVRASLETSAENGNEPNRNHLPIEWITGIPDDLVAEIVGGRNTAMQVQDKTLANHEHKFDWLKELLAGERYANKIAYRENESRKDKPVDVRELLALISPFNRELYSLQSEAGKKLPVAAFSQKKSILDTYILDQDDNPNGEDERTGRDERRGRKTYCRLREIVKDILELHDLIHLEAVELYNKAKEGKGKGGKFMFVDHKAAKEHEFVFTGKSGPDRLADGALYPMLAAFSALVTTGKDGNFVWSTPDSFAGVKRLWREFAAKFMELTANKSYEVGRNPGQIGKSTNHWEFLYLQVAMKAQTEGLGHAK